MSTRKTFMRRYSLIVAIVVVLLLLGAAQFFSWPYVIYGPGSAEPVHPRVETGHKLDEGVPIRSPVELGRWYWSLSAWEIS